MLQLQQQQQQQQQHIQPRTPQTWGRETVLTTSPPSVRSLYWGSTQRHLSHTSFMACKQERGEPGVTREGGHPGWVGAWAGGWMGGVGGPVGWAGGVGGWPIGGRVCRLPNPTRLQGVPIGRDQRDGLCGRQLPIYPGLLGGPLCLLLLLLLHI